MVKHPVGRFTAFMHAAAVGLVACATGLLPACGGSDDEPATPSASPLSASAQPSVEGARVTGREEALRIVVRGVVAPLYYGELVQGALARAFALRPSAVGAEAPAAPGDRWVVVAPGAGPFGDGRTEIEIEAADQAEGLLLRGEAGSVRAVLRFENAALGAARFDGAVTLDVSRAGAGAGSAHRTRAETLAVVDAQGTRHWSFLDVDVDAQQVVQRLTVVSDLTTDPAAPIWIDVVANSPGRLDAARGGAILASGSYMATGVTGFLNARVALQVEADRGWTIAVDNDQDDEIDFVVRASADEARALAR